MSEKKIRINIVVGGTFHLPMMLNNLIELGYDVHAYTSTPKFKLKGQCPVTYTTTIIKPFQILNKVTGWRIPRWAAAFDEYMFDRIVSIIMRPCEILIGFANASLYSGSKTKSHGGVYLLDRACPHAQEIAERLDNEAKKIGFSFSKPNPAQIKRSLKEYSQADKILIPSNYSINSFLKMGFSKEKILKVQLEAKIKTPEKIPSLPNTLIIGAIGTEVLRKGFYYLIKAFDSIDIKDARLILKAPRKEIMKHPELKAIIDRNPDIEFCGYVEDINKFYQKCSLFCLPSIDDGFGMVVCEAMSNGLPVIVTDSAGASEFIKDGVNGFVVPAGDIDSIKQKLIFFSENANKRMVMGHEARRSYISYEQSFLSYKTQIDAALDQVIKDKFKLG